MFNKKFRGLIILAIAVLFLAISTAFSYAQERSVSQKVTAYSVVLSGEPLFEIKARISSFSAEVRAQAISQRIEAFAEDSSIPIDSLKLEDKEDETDIIDGDKIILSLVDADAKVAQKSRQELAAEYFNKIKDSVQRYRDSRSLRNILFGVLYAFLATIALLIIFKILSQILSRTLRNLDVWRDTRIPPLRIQNIEILPATQITDILIRSLKFLRLVLFLGIFYLYLLLVLSFFPWTKQIGASLSSYLLKAVGGVFQSFFAYLPNLFVIALVVVFTFYILQFVRFIFAEIGRGTFALSGFYPEWARPTSKLATFLIIALAVIVAFPYLPGAQSPAFQGVSVFLGLLLSLGSSAAVANVVAGVILIYTRAFEVGDRVKVGDAIGDIVEKTLLVTRIRTIKNVVITIPNASVLNAQIINYSSAAQDCGTPPMILHTTILGM